MGGRDSALFACTLNQHRCQHLRTRANTHLFCVVCRVSGPVEGSMTLLCRTSACISRPLCLSLPLSLARAHCIGLSPCTGISLSIVGYPPARSLRHVTKPTLPLAYLCVRPHLSLTLPSHQQQPDQPLSPGPSTAIAQQVTCHAPALYTYIK